MFEVLSVMEVIVAYIGNIIKLNFLIKKESKLNLLIEKLQNAVDLGMC